MVLVMRYFVLFFSFLLVGCSSIPTPSFIQNRDKHYLQAKSIPPLKIPPGLSSDAIKNTYPVSDTVYSNKSMEVDLTPPGLYTNASNSA